METISNSYNQKLANYFASKSLYLDEPIQKKPNTRKLVEQPWQQTKGKLWDEVTQTLCNLDFIQAKAAAKMTYELVNDFNEVLLIIPDNQENINEEKERQARMDKYAQDFIACARGELTTEEIEIPESTTTWSHEKIEREIMRMKTNPSKVGFLKDFSNFLGLEAQNLQSFASQFADFATQQAWNYANSGPVMNHAENSAISVLKHLLLRKPMSRQLWQPFPQISRILHINTSRVIAFTLDGKKAITGESGLNASCILWDLTTGRDIKILKAQTEGITSIAITPDGKKAISGSADKTCVLWDLENGQAIQTFKANTESIIALAITPDGKRAISGSLNNTCIYWDLSTGQIINTLKGHRTYIISVSITPNGENAVSCSSDNVFIIWDLKNGEAIRILDKYIKPIHSVYSAAFTPDGKMAITSIYQENICIIWNLVSGHQIKTFKGHNGPGIFVDITHDGKMALVASECHKTCTLWDLSTGNSIKTLIGHTDWITAVAISSNGEKALSASNDGTCIQWDLTTGQTIQTIVEHKDYVQTFSINQDGKWALTGSDDHSCILWDLRTGKARKELRQHTDLVVSVAITPNGKKAVTGSSDKTIIIWDIISGHAIKTISTHLGGIMFVSITADGKRLFSCCMGGIYSFWNLSNGQEISTLELHTIPAFYYKKLTTFGKMAIIDSINDHTCIVWDLDVFQPTKILKGHTKNIRCITHTPDRKIAISGSQDRTCIVWDLNTGKARGIFNQHTDSVQFIAIRPDGKCAISVSSDRTCILWSLTTLQQIITLKGHTAGVNSVSFTPDGKKVITGSYDKTCILWDIESGKKIRQFIANSAVNVSECYQGGFFIVEHSGQIIILNTINEQKCSNIAIVTIQQIWDFEYHRYQSLSADCPLCGHRFAPQPSVVTTIEEITKSAGLKPDQSPCLELPDEAWEDPGLLGNCPECGEGLKFNPFIAGG